MAIGIIMALMMPVCAQATIDKQIQQIDNQIEQKNEQVESAKTQLESLSTTLDASVKEYQEANLKLQEIDAAVEAKQRELNSASEQQLFYQKILNKLSVFTYRDGDIYFLEVVLGTRSFKDLVTRVDYLSKLNHRQAYILKAAKNLRKSIQKKQDALDTEKARQRSVVSSIQGKQDEINRLLAEEQATIDSLGTDISTLQADRKKKEEEKAALAALPTSTAVGTATVNMMFPIAKNYAHSFINDWGYPRAGNPSGHQGNDIFATKGTPVVATADGVISDEFGYLNIGGYRLHVIADNGVNYYYAHLNNDTPGTDDGLGAASTAYASGIGPGVRVAKGQVIGYVGDSGDAETTPPHLHFGIVINGSWVNPFYSLKACDWK